MENSRNIDKLLKDRGDNTKRYRTRAKREVRVKCDRGDAAKVRTIIEKPSECDRRIEIKHTEPVKNSEANKRQSDFERENKRFLDRRRKIRDKYTIKNYLQDCNRISNTKDLPIDVKKDVTLIAKQEQREKSELTKSEPSKASRTDKENQNNQKVPVIRTITTKNDSKVYKAVTFTAQKRNPLTALQVDIPTTRYNNCNRIPKLIKPKLKTASRTSVIHGSEKFAKKSKRWQRKHATSPTLNASDSPPTEVAKWAPDCINRHTKPYYEAWVNTTLAAISRNSKGRSCVGKQQLMKTVQHVLERSESPELVYKDFKDERNIGRIKIKRR